MSSPTPPAPIGPILGPEDAEKPLLNYSLEALSDWPVRLAVVLMTLMLFFPFIGSFGLWDPWEGHYGEVARQMIERGDWISPWWGSHWEIPGKSAEGHYFFSKPVLLLWMMGIGMQVFGFGEVGIRFGVAMVASIAAISVYMAGERIFNRRVGVLMALALGTSPFFTMLGRQSQTDMPFVGLMTAALAFFMMAMFGRDRNDRADRLSWLLLGGFLLAVTLPQYHTIVVGQLTWRTDLSPVEAFFTWGPAQFGIYLLMLAIVGVTLLRSRGLTRGQLYLFTFYAFVALATMAKGLLGFALPGAIILLYLIVTREWDMLRRAEIPRGVLLCLAVGFPWYGAMFARHGGIGGAFWDRFIIHDHFRRLAEGVHQTDTGSFEHFIKWLGYGLFPWGSLVPVILMRALSGDAGSTRTDQDKARIFLMLWFAMALTLFTLSSTKFHHYIFPAVPAIALLAALALEDLWTGRIKLSAKPLLLICGGVLLVVVGWDLIRDPQHLKNLFTYKYDRRWDADAWNPTLILGLKTVFTLSLVAWCTLWLARTKKGMVVGLALLGVTSLGFAHWNLQVYMPKISPTWSQAELWHTYYSLCTRIEGPRGAHPMKRYCEEPVIGYRLNWRGENFYTQNEIIPIRDDEEWDYFWEINEERCFYAFTFKGRWSRLRNALPEEHRATIEVVHSDNLKFDLVAVGCSTPEEIAERAGEDEDDESQDEEEEEDEDQPVLN